MSPVADITQIRNLSDALENFNVKKKKNEEMEIFSKINLRRKPVV